VVDVAMLQTLTRKTDIEQLTSGYGLVVVDECHHIPAAAFEHAVKQIPARRWLGLTATPYRRDKLDDLIALQLGPVRHTITQSNPPGEDVIAALKRGRHCLLLTQWTAHVERFAHELRRRSLDPIVLRGGMSATARRDALARLHPVDGAPLLVVATGPFVGEGFDCPVLDTLFLAAPIAFKGRLVQYAGRILRAHPGKTTAEVHDYDDVNTGVLASSLAKRAPGYVSLGFPDPRRSASTR
jgi:superfamily II DNA or RNA helicase